MDLDSSLQHLSSKPLLGYQLDASHLHTVLQNIMRSSQQQVQAVNGLATRVGNLEGAVEGINGRVNQIENALGKFGGADELSQLRQNMVEIAKATDALNHNVIPALKRDVEQSVKQTEQATQALQPLTNAVMQLEQSDNTLKQDLDSLNRNLNSANDTQRQVVQQVQQLMNDHQNRERNMNSQQERAEQQLAQMAQKADKLERELGQRLGNQMEELNKRTNDNFMQVEQSSRAVDDELRKLRADLGDLGLGLNTLDNDTRVKFVKVTDDLDAKFNILLDSMQTLQKNSSELDHVLIQAGQALANNKRSASTAGTPINTPMYGSGTTTTTHVALGNEGGLAGAVNRTGSMRGGSAAGGSSNNFRML